MAGADSPEELAAEAPFVAAIAFMIFWLFCLVRRPSCAADTRRVAGDAGVFAYPAAEQSTFGIGKPVRLTLKWSAIATGVSGGRDHAANTAHRRLWNWPSALSKRARQVSLTARARLRM